MRIAVVVVAAGRGTRAGRIAGRAKQYALIDGKTVLRRTLEAFAGHPRTSLIQVVTHPADTAAYAESCADLSAPLLPPVDGGPSRQASVLAGLESLRPHAPDVVLIHDAARPFVDTALIDRVLGALVGTDGAIPGLRITDTMKQTDADGRILATLPRDALWRAQTPQGFHYAAIHAAHLAARTAGLDHFTDDAALAEWRGLRVVMVEGAEQNRKLTTPEDFAMTASTSGLPDIRNGTGFDVHRFAPGDTVWLGGVAIPHTHRLDGHSDADVALHALTDAILGAIGDGDIGQHFPPSDDKWKGQASHLFLADAMARVRKRGGRLTNVDLTILCEAPRIGPHRDAMRQRIAEILGVEPDRVGVKATTTEGLGFTGRREGIAAMATATVILP